MADADTRRSSKNWKAPSRDYQGAISSILGNMQPLVLSKQAGSRIFRGSEDLLKATDNLALAIRRVPAAVAWYSFSSFC